MINLNIGRQTFEFDCGPKALQLVMAYYGVDMREDELIKELGTDQQQGTPVANMIAVAESKGFHVQAKNGWSLDELKELVDKGHPVIVLLQAWAERYMTLEDWRNNYDDGHYAIVIGYTNGIMVFEDPSSIRRTWLTEEEFLVRWHDKDADQKYERFGMVLLGKEPLRQTTEHMD